MHSSTGSKKGYVRFLPAIFAATVLTLTVQETDAPSEISPDKTVAASISGTETEEAISTQGNYMIVLKDGLAPDQQSARNIISGILEEHIISTPSISSFSEEIKGVIAGISADDALKIRNDHRIALVEADQPLTLLSAPENNSTVIPADVQTVSWGVSRVGFGDGTALNRTAWIVDSGIQPDHPDLNVDLERSKSFIPGNASPADEFGHGTQVAGILAAKNNNIGVVGVAAGAKVVSLRVMDKKGHGSISSVISALEHVSRHGKPGDVVNLSLASAPSVTLDNAALEVAKKGIFVVIAAGNIADNSAKYSPARVNHPNIFTISAMRADNTYMGVSNWGSPVDFCAPGSRLQSTRINSGYGNAAGTSMAAPHVAGILLLKGNNIATQGTVANDPDGNPDPIAKL